MSLVRVVWLLEITSIVFIPKGLDGVYIPERQFTVMS